MASINERKNGYRRIQFRDPNGQRQSVRLGKVTRKQAEAVKLHIENLTSSRITGHSVSDGTARWMADIGDELASELARVGLIARRETETLEQFITGYIDSRSDIEPATARAWRQALRRLVAWFGSDRRLRDISRKDSAEWRQGIVNEGLADASVRKYTGYAKHFFSVAVDRDVLPVSPFEKLVSGSIGNEERQHFVSREDTQRLIDQCPDATWRLIVALSRYGGLRCPSEHGRLRWQDIDWDSGVMTVTSPKTKKLGKPTRNVPLFDELLPYLRDCFELPGTGDEFVLSKHRDPSGAYIRKRLEILIRRAGMDVWPRITHNLRASRQTELERNNPTHVVCAIMGNTPRVANRHYLTVSDEDLMRAAQSVVQSPVLHASAMSAQGLADADSAVSSIPTQRDTVRRLATQDDSFEHILTGVDWNRTHLASFQRPHRV